MVVNETLWFERRSDLKMMIWVWATCFDNFRSIFDRLIEIMAIKKYQRINSLQNENGRNMLAFLPC